MTVPTAASGWPPQLPAARIAPLPANRLGSVARLVLARIRHVEGVRQDYNVFRTFARLGSIFPAHTLFLSQLLLRGRLEAQERELVILRVAWRLSCAYEWGHHTHMAHRLGVPAESVAAAARVVIATGDERQAAFWAAADELLATNTIGDETWQKLRGVATEDELLELFMLIGHYVMVAMTLNAAGVSSSRSSSPTCRPHRERPRDHRA